MRHQTLERVQYIFLFVLFIALAGIGLIAARTAGLGLPDAAGFRPQGVVSAAWDRQIAFISGHAGNDSGAICEDDNGNVLLTEADINARVAKLAGERLQRAGADVVILEEYDGRLRGLKADVLLSIHADSCIDATGYKAAVHQDSLIPVTNEELLTCLDSVYPEITGLPHHPNTVTHNMTEYHAFRRIDPQTPAAIIELGFLGGDQALLVEQPEVVAKGVVDSLLCFLEKHPKRS